MSFNRSLALLILFSLCAGTALFFLGADPGEYRGGYAALITDAAIPDRILRERLASCESGFGGPPVSESSQWALLDEFGSLAKIPLDEYPGRVFPFDPRNDGYAERLRSFFIRDEKRYVFIPLKTNAPSAAASLETRIAAALGDIPFSLGYPGFGKPLGFYLLLFAAASAGTLFVRRGQPYGGHLIPALPVLASLARCGVPGFVLCAPLLGLSALLGEPLAEWRILRRYRNRGYGFFRDVYEPFRWHWLLTPFFLTVYGGTVFFSGLSIPFTLAAAAAYAGIYLFSERVSSLSGSRRHLRFVPVLIMKAPLKAGFFVAGKPALNMLPFVLAALIAALAAHAGGAPSTGVSAFAGNILITEAEYRSHAEFQASFSERPLGRRSFEDQNPGDSLYGAYRLDPDSLISPAAVLPGESSMPPPEIPPFPLKPLMDFLAACAR